MRAPDVPDWLQCACQCVHRPQDARLGCLTMAQAADWPKDGVAANEMPPVDVVLNAALFVMVARDGEHA